MKNYSFTTLALWTKDKYPELFRLLFTPLSEEESTENHKFTLTRVNIIAWLSMERRLNDRRNELYFNKLLPIILGPEITASDFELTVDKLIMQQIELDNIASDDVLHAALFHIAKGEGSDVNLSVIDTRFLLYESLV